MRIGIDIDGVLTDFEKWQLDYGSEYFSDNKGIHIKDINGYDTNEVFNITKEQDSMFWKKYLYTYVTKEPARKFASQIIQKLKNDNHEIYIVTSRYLTNRNTPEGENMRNIVKTWLQENNISYDKIIFSPEEKLDTCIENCIDIMVEDKLENINTIATKIPVMCFHANYNKSCRGNNISRCYTWYDVYAKINEIII